MNSTVIAAFILCSLSWISVSVSGSQIMQVQSGEEVTLQCSNMSAYDSPTFWFRLVDKSNGSCISIRIKSYYTVEYCDGLKSGKFDMSSNISDVFLKIKPVNISDSGLYFCGFYTDARLRFSVIRLNVEDSNKPHDDREGNSKSRDEPHDDADIKCKKESDGTAKLTSVILGALTVFLVIVIIGLVVKIRKLQTADKEEQNAEQNENVGSDDLNYAAVTFQRKAKRRELEPNVIYAATR